MISDFTELAAGDKRLRGMRAAILVAVAAMWAGCLAVPVVAVLREPASQWRWLGAGGLLTLAAAFAVTLIAVGTPVAATRRWGFAAATALSIPLVAPVGPDDMFTWAWVGGAVAGFAPLVLAGRARWAAPVALVVTTAFVGHFAGGSPLVHGLIAAALAATILATTVLPFRLWDLLLQARAGREAQARLAVSEERLRFARDVHDLLGHRLAVIALKAELAARLSGADPERAASEASEARNLATSALSEVREAVHGYREVDLGGQLVAVENVLRDAGIRCTVRYPDGAVPAETATQLALALREACTNVLRHSTAGWCTIEIRPDPEEVRMTIANDGAGKTVADGLGFGLRGASERLAGLGGTLGTRLDGDVFTLDVTVPAS
ncbi:sensor histidine kinase [Amycolatopsis pittospori]|uniref:sensor histidine kinase n=1 Tax=Amycolatopsis pittospori TaxID=2749434 RepID=UPI001A9F037C|nr:histidine kinase [Amycolatopsis pittospori]